MKTPILETERLTLKAIIIDDALTMQKLFGTWSIIKNFAVVVPWPYPENGSARYISQESIPKMESGTLYEWTIRLKENDQLIGSLALRLKENNTAKRDFWLAENFQGQGFMTEAVKAVQDFAFFKAGIARIIADTAVSNAASRRVKEKTAARYVKTFPLHYHNGDQEAEQWEIRKEDWQKFKPLPASSLSRLT
jgi:ribosomal-protein-alanine N-acetyltransferase